MFILHCFTFILLGLTFILLGLTFTLHGLTFIAFDLDYVRVSSVIAEEAKLVEHVNTIFKTVHIVTQELRWSA